jgi:hypothetical protein
MEDETLDEVQNTSSNTLKTDTQMSENAREISDPNILKANIADMQRALASINTNSKRPNNNKGKPVFKSKTNKTNKYQSNNSKTPALSTKAKFTGECYICGKQGHKSADCWHRKDKNNGMDKNNDKKRSSSNLPECSHCHKFGHTEVNCWFKNKKEKNSDEDERFKGKAFITFPDGRKSEFYGMNDGLGDSSED